MKITLMRHGITVWNEKGITQGQTSNRLSTKGKEESSKLAEIIKDKFDIIYCSPLQRAVQTANIVNLKKVKIIKDDRLKDIDQGVFSGRYYSSLTEKEKKLKFLRSKLCNMESYKSIVNRTKSFYKDIILKSKYNKILIVSHNINVSILECLIKNQPIDTETNLILKTFKNSQFKEFEI